MYSLYTCVWICIKLFFKSKVVLPFHFILDMEGNGGMIHMNAPLKEFLCISLQNILNMDNLVDVYRNSF